MQVFVMIYNRGIVTNADVTAKNWLTKFDVIMNLFGTLVYGNASCKCRKILVNKLFEECRENINASEMICNVTLNDHGKVCKSCTIYIIYIVLLIITFIILMGTGNICIYFYWHTIKNCCNKLLCYV